MLALVLVLPPSSSLPVVVPGDARRVWVTVGSSSGIDRDDGRRRRRPCPRRRRTPGRAGPAATASCRERDRPVPCGSASSSSSAVVVRRCRGRRRPVNVGQSASVGGGVVSCCGGRIGGDGTHLAGSPFLVPPPRPPSFVGPAWSSWSWSWSLAVVAVAVRRGRPIGQRRRRCRQRSRRTHRGGRYAPRGPSVALSVRRCRPPLVRRRRRRCCRERVSSGNRHERAVPLTCRPRDSEIALEGPGTPVDGGVSVGGRENTPVLTSMTAISKTIEHFLHGIATESPTFPPHKDRRPQRHYHFCAREAGFVISCD